MSDQFRIPHNEFFVSGPEVEYKTEVVSCCREWEIVTHVITYPQNGDMPHIDRFDWRRCGYCGQVPYAL